MFTGYQLQIIAYCAEECRRQGSGELSVSHMLHAYEFASRIDERWHGAPSFTNVTLDFIKTVGALIEPEKNKDGFRTVPIYIRDWNYPGGARPIGSNWQSIERHLTVLLESYYEGSFGKTGIHDIAKSPEDQFFFEYESIHPFLDGNGRSGVILYNYLRGSLDNPVWPPDFFGGKGE